MNKLLSAIAFTCIGFSAYAQSNKESLKYEANQYDVRKEEKAYSYKSTGQLFKERMDAFRKISDSKAKSFISNNDYNKFLDHFSTLRYSDEKAGKRLENFNAALTAASNTPHITKDGYRNKLYHTAFPLQVAVEEEWGTDVMDVVLSDAWRDLNSYVGMLAKDDRSLSGIAMQVNTGYIHDLGIMNENAKTCTYNIFVDKPLQKDKIEVYFCETRIANLINNLGIYPQDRLLTGPIGNYTTLRDESKNLLHFLENAKHDKSNNIHYIKFTPKSPSAKAQEELQESTEWYMYAFRNGALYYSYMALPCSRFNTCTIKELMLTDDMKQLEEGAASIEQPKTP